MVSNGIISSHDVTKVILDFALNKGTTNERYSIKVVSPKSKATAITVPYNIPLCGE